MHFNAALILSVLPLGVFAAAVPKEDADVITKTFKTSTGEERTVYLGPAPKTGLEKRRQASAPKLDLPMVTGADFLYLSEPSDQCGESTFDNKSSEGSPLVADCECVRDYMRQENGEYSVAKWHANYAGLVTCGTCTFGAHTSNIFGSDVGNTDIADLVDEAIRRFQWNGKVGAQGHMGCRNLFETAKTHWAIVHS